ncbi:MAG TPA: zinc ribbon domain-containing protein [Xanthomonadaceae bacterium]|nr:zinc ribbon domain-containing protein [Xanthomonadaceae bacterium]
MPIYEYQGEGGCAKCSGRFELIGRVSDPDLDACPACGGPIRRIISPPNVVGGDAHRLGEDHVGKHGFTQYRKIGKGVYEKTAGKGPNVIKDG